LLIPRPSIKFGTKKEGSFQLIQAVGNSRGTAAVSRIVKHYRSQLEKGVRRAQGALRQREKGRKSNRARTTNQRDLTGLQAGIFRKSRPFRLIHGQAMDAPRQSMKRSFGEAVILSEEKFSTRK